MCVEWGLPQQLNWAIHDSRLLPGIFVSRSEQSVHSETTHLYDLRATITTTTTKSVFLVWGKTGFVNLRQNRSAPPPPDPMSSSSEFIWSTRLWIHGLEFGNHGWQVLRRSQNPVGNWFSSSLNASLKIPSVPPLLTAVISASHFLSNMAPEFFFERHKKSYENFRSCVFLSVLVVFLMSWHQCIWQIVLWKYGWWENHITKIWPDTLYYD